MRSTPKSYAFMQVYDNSRRPSERTEQFFRDYLSQQRHLPGDRLPSPRQIAAALGVSESTVRGVVRKWLQEGKLRSRQGSGIFICRTPHGTRPLRIGANVRNDQKQQHANWGDSIHSSVLEAVLELGPRGAFTSLYSSAEDINALSSKEIASRCHDLDGMILYQSDPHISGIAAYCQQHGKPFVYLNPPTDDSVSNFVALENFTSFYRVTRALRDCGRKRFALLIYPSPERSVSVRQRLSGTINGIAEQLGVSVHLKIQLCDGFHEKSGYDAVRKLLQKGAFQPDAILCAGDELALGALDALREHKLSIPKEVSVISGAGFDARIRERQITSLVQPLREVGRHLVTMLLGMIERQVFEVPAHILPIDIRTGQTTTPDENECLKSKWNPQQRV